MTLAFDSAFVRGLGASVPGYAVTLQSSQVGVPIVGKSVGDPNYYATRPQFDSRGFWHSAGSSAPYETPSGDPETPAEGQWVAQGKTTRNGQSTTTWIWYPPNHKTITIGTHRPGDTIYTISRSRPSGSSLKLFSSPDYWVHKQTVPMPEKSVYRPQALMYDPPAGTVPVVGTFVCKNWFMVVRVNASGPYIASLNAGLSGGMFDAESIFNFYMRYLGVSPYFTYKGCLFRFVPEGRHLSIQVCTDGLIVRKNPSGSSPAFTLYEAVPSGTVRGIGSMELAFDQNMRPGPTTPALCAPCTSSCGGIEATHATAMQALREEGLGRAPHDASFNVALVRGLGQLSQLTSGSNGPVTIVPFTTTNRVPPVDAKDWVDFYPNDPYGFRANTNLALNASEQASGGGIGAFSGANPIGGGILSAIQPTAGRTGFWQVTDPNNRAAYTVSSMEGNTSGDGSSPGVAIIRSRWPHGPTGQPVLSIAMKTVPVPMSQVPGWPSAASPASSVPSGLTWAQISGPVGGDLASVSWPGHMVALAGADEAGVLNAYLSYISQPQFLQGIPSLAWGPWYGAGFNSTPLPIPTSVPAVYFNYGSQLYRVRWYGRWIPGQGPGAPNSGPAIEVCTNLRSFAPTTTPSKIVAPPSTIATPTTFPTGFMPTPAPGVTPANMNSATAALLQNAVSSTSAPVVSVPYVPVTPIPAPASVPTAVVVVSVILALGLAGGVAYLVLE
jgi:hypothetical protein